MEQYSRLVLLDVDGTLVTPMGDMPAGTAEAVAALRRGGSAAVFFTGRPLSHVAPLLRGAAFDGGICVMGAFTFLHGETLCARSPDPASAQRLAAAARERGLEAVFETAEGVRLDPAAHTPRLDGLRRAFAAKGLAVSPAEGEFSYEKLCLWGEAGALDAFARAAEGDLAVVGRKQDMLELAAPGASPAAAVARVSARLGVTKEKHLRRGRQRERSAGALLRGTHRGGRKRGRGAESGGRFRRPADQRRRTRGSAETLRTYLIL